MEVRGARSRLALTWCLAFAVGLTVQASGAGVCGPFGLAIASRAAAEEPDRPPDAGVSAAIGTLVGSSGGTSIDGERLEQPLLQDLYGPRNFAPLWVNAPDAPARAAAVAAVLAQASAEGLDPNDYHVHAIQRRLPILDGSTPADDRMRAELDLLLSDALMHYAVHVKTGAYRPTRPTKEIELEAIDLDPTRFAIEAAFIADVQPYLATLPPHDPAYQRLKEALARYRQLDASGGWPSVPDGPKLNPGVSDQSVRGLRERLRVAGELEQAGPVRKPDTYDPALVKAVKRFQARHGLGADGVVGDRTRAELNVDAHQRVQQIELALERRRWLPASLGDRFVMINIPDQHLVLRDQGVAEIEMPVIVGKPTWQTPQFSADMTDLVFNPPWNVPPKIAREELLPKMRGDGSFFAKQGIVVRGGVKVASAHDAGVASDSAPSGADVVVVGPIRLRQAPGPKNPLGHVKFNMPNGFGVYLHDTPNHEKFRVVDRRLSHGCVRVGNAQGLAAAVLRDSPNWDEERRMQAIADWQTHTAALPAAIPVHVVYQTAWVDEDGTVQFRDDVYGRDADLIAMTGHPRTVRRPPVPPPTPPAVADQADVAEGSPSAEPPAPQIDARKRAKAPDADDLSP